MKIFFSKMHGLGNDFVVINTLSQTFNESNFPVKEFSDRHIGIGFDQLLLIGPSRLADFSCRIFNADGSEAEQCGNGMRCVARYIREENLTDKPSFTIENKSGLVEVKIDRDFDHVEVNMGLPIFESPCEIKIDHQSIQLFQLSLGNPHAIMHVDSVAKFPVSTLGPKISTHEIFPHGANVGFMEIINRKHIRLRTFERGSGETLACGSNSCAAVVAGIENNWLDKKVRVELALGDLWIEWNGKSHPVLMAGPAERVFEGVIMLY